MSTEISIAALMEQSGVRFGTSGIRGLVTDMTDRFCYTSAAGFIQYLEEQPEPLRRERRIALAGDLRPSTGRILGAVAQACTDRGWQPLLCGRIPSPAVALYGLQQKMPTIMITGSHIPDDRNGLKFTVPNGEILKEDEEGIRRQQMSLPDLFDQRGMFRDAASVGMRIKLTDATGSSRDCGTERFGVPASAGLSLCTCSDAAEAYRQRWLGLFPPDFLRGRRLGLYQHSAVGRDLLLDIYARLGAEVIPFGRSERFLPIDTEAIRPEDSVLARQWAAENRVDAILSTDGDSDRPLISDEHGQWLRGDIAALLCALYLQAEVVVLPVSCNTAVEKCEKFREVRRTKIGSPYVIAGMQAAINSGYSPVVGYEANGGFLTATPIPLFNGILEPLPTRDPVIVHLGVLGLAACRNMTISQLLATLPQRFTASDRLQNVSAEDSRRLLEALAAGGQTGIDKILPGHGPLAEINQTDGLRLIFSTGEIVHFRPSGNAPELRVYAESASAEAADALVQTVLAKLAAGRS